MHLGKDRITGTIAWTGGNDKQYLKDFEGAWVVFLKALRPQYRDVFRDEINHRLDSEFLDCGSLGKEFIL